METFVLFFSPGCLRADSRGVSPGEGREDATSAGPQQGVRSCTVAVCPCLYDVVCSRVQVRPGSTIYCRIEDEIVVCISWWWESSIYSFFRLFRACMLLLLYHRSIIIWHIFPILFLFSQIEKHPNESKGPNFLESGRWLPCFVNRTPEFLVFGPPEFVVVGNRISSWSCTGTSCNRTPNFLLSDPETLLFFSPERAAMYHAPFGTLHIAVFVCAHCFLLVVPAV